MTLPESLGVALVVVSVADDIELGGGAGVVLAMVLTAVVVAVDGWLSFDPEDALFRVDAHALKRNGIARRATTQ
jgi:hypothetical protein